MHGLVKHRLVNHGLVKHGLLNHGLVKHGVEFPEWLTTQSDKIYRKFAVITLNIQ